MTTMKNLVKTMLMSILTAGTMMSFTACSSEDDVLMETKGNVSLDINQYATAESTSMPLQSAPYWCIWQGRTICRNRCRRTWSR